MPQDFAAAVGQQAGLDNWAIVVTSWRVSDGSVDGAKPPPGSHWLVAQLTVTNLDGQPQTFFAPDQITLDYRTPTLEVPGGNVGCATGFCQSERNPEFGDDTSRILSGQSAHWGIVFLVPNDANGFRLAVRGQDDQRATHAAIINLICC